MSTSYALTAAQCKELMENFVSPFSKASSAKRKTIIQRAVDAVSPSDTNATLRTKTENKVKEFLRNHGGRREEEKEMVNYTRSWTAYTVALHENKDMLDRKMQEKHPEMIPSAKEYLGLRQVLASEWYKQQPETRRSMYQKLAETWNTENSPAEVQRKLAKEKGDLYVADFARQMYRKCGMRVLVAVAFIDPDEQLNISLIDNNHKFDGAPKFDDDRNGWKEKDYMTEWGIYASKLMNPDGLSDTDNIVTQKKRTSNYVQEFTDDGDLIIPAANTDILKSVRDKQAFVRAFFSHNYSISAGKDVHKHFPWADFHNSKDLLIAPETLPDGFNIRDPSKMVAGEVEVLINHWRERLEEGLKPLEFRGYKNKRGDIVPCAIQRLSLDELIPMENVDGSGSEGSPSKIKRRKVKKVASGFVTNNETHDSDSEQQPDEQFLQSMDSNDTLPTVREDTKLKGRRRTKNRNNQTDRDSDGTDAPQESTAEPYANQMDGNHQCDSAAARAQDISAEQETPRPRRQRVNMRGEKGVKGQHSKGTLTTPAKGKKRKPVEAHEESAGEVDGTPPPKRAKRITTTSQTPETPRRRYSTRGGGLRRHVVPKAMLKDKH